MRLWFKNFAGVALIAVTLVLLARLSHAQISYELACPAGYSPQSTLGMSFDAVTGLYRANICVSDTGNGRLVCQMDGCGSGGFPGPVSITATLPVKVTPSPLTATGVISINNFTGDTGAGGLKGAVPAPAAGDTAAGKFLGAGGGWSVPAGTGVPTTRNINTTLPLTGGGPLSADLTLAINVFTGDSGAGGLVGAVPAPAAGDAAAGKFLGAGGSWTAPPAIPAKYNTRTCLVVTGDPGTASPALADDNDAPAMCGNDTGVDETVTAVACYADAGTPTVNPILTGGAATSILSGALTCGTASWAAGTVNGSPVLHTFSGTGATCAATPCTLDGNIATAGGTAKYLVMKITLTF